MTPGQRVRHRQKNGHSFGTGVVRDTHLSAIPATVLVKWDTPRRIKKRYKKVGENESWVNMENLTVEDSYPSAITDP